MSAKTFVSLVMTVICLPLLLLLGLQYRSLAQIQADNQRALSTNLSRYVDISSEKAMNHYANKADRFLNIPARNFQPEWLLEHVSQISEKEMAAVHTFFYMTFSYPRSQFRIFDKNTSAWVTSPKDPLLQSVSLAASHWYLRQKKGLTLPTDLQTNHDQKDHPVIMKIILDQEGRGLGLMGLVLDPHYFTNQFLATIIPSALDRTFPDSTMVAVVMDATGTLRYQFPRNGEPIGQSAQAAFPFAFSDWQIQVFAGEHSTLQTRKTFVASLLLALLLCMLPAVGVALILKAMLKHRQLSAMKSDFVSNVSHELRTPMSSMHLLGEMMRSGKVSSAAKIKEYGELIELESDRLTRLIEHILDFSKIESNQVQYSLTWFDLVELTQKLVSGFRKRPDLGDIHFEECYAVAIATVRADEVAIKQALFNLLDNAVKYGPAKQTISLELFQDERKVYMRIRDQGPGIEKDQRELIFERFHRISEGDIQAQRGSGLGLTIARHIARSHGGDINVLPNPGGGSCFEFFINMGTP